MLTILPMVKKRRKKEIEQQKALEALTKELQIKNMNLQKCNKELRETMEIRTNFLTIASHQLRTPTSVIRSSLQMIIDGTLVGKQKNDFIKRSLAQANKLAETIHDLLSATAVEGRGFKLNKSSVNMNELVSAVIKIKKNDLKQRNKERNQNVKLIYRPLNKQTRPINIDLNKIKEAIINLVDNAIQYTLKGEIEITSKMDEKKFILVVKDTGIGIEKKDIPRLFKKFVRLNNAIKLNPNGIGLGLFIVKGMVKNHGGKAQAKSDGLGKGSIFTFWIPIK